MKGILLLCLDRILTLKFFLKLKIFKSSLGELSSLIYKLHHLNSQISFLFKGFKIKKNYKSISFNNNGFSCFSNKIIEKNSAKILTKVNVLENQWIDDGNFKYDPTSKFKNEIINIFDNGIDQFLKSLFKSDYCIFDHYLYKSDRKSIKQIPSNSQLWHSDGYPGIGLNLLISHTPISKNNGSMKIINWGNSAKLLTKLFFDYKQFVRNAKLNSFNSKNRMLYRTIKCEMLKNYIENQNIEYFQPESEKSGIVFAFSNNCVHAGGYTDVGQERIVSLFHIYPSPIKRTLKEKLNFCMKKKKGSYPGLKEVFQI